MSASSCIATIGLRYPGEVEIIADVAEDVSKLIAVLLCEEALQIRHTECRRAGMTEKVAEIFLRTPFVSHGLRQVVSLEVAKTFVRHVLD